MTCPAPSQATPRVLAVDDRREVLRLIERSMGDRYECELAQDLDEARERLAAAPFQLALCDIQMPGESGLVLVEEIARKHEEMAVVLVTGVDDPDVAERAFHLGAHGYLVKPFWPGQLRITAANAMRQRELELAEQARHAVLLGSAEERAAALRHELIDAQRQAIEVLRSSQQETVERLALAIELRDTDTGAHVNRMASIAALLAERLEPEPEPERVQLLRAAASLHDVGKIGIPDAILRKEGPLTDAERSEMQRHTTIGHRILADSDSDLLRMGATIALTHHERFDGGGYPHGLRGAEIPLEGRIVAVADVFDALLSERCYRPAWATEEAVELVRHERGGHFDPDIAELLLDNLDEALELR